MTRSRLIEVARRRLEERAHSAIPTGRPAHVDRLSGAGCHAVGAREQYIILPPLDHRVEGPAQDDDLEAVRAVREARLVCSLATPDHPKYPAACAKCHLGIAWMPHEGAQSRFISATVRELLYGGQAGGGKTSGLVAIPLRWVPHSRFNALILRRDTTQLTRLLAEAAALYPKGVPGAQSRKMGNGAVWTFPSGAQIRFDHCEQESDIARYDGDEFQFVGYDELTHFTQAQYVGINARIRSPVDGLPRFSRATSNPGGAGHEWVFRRWGPWLDPKAKVAGLRERRDQETGELLPPALPGQVLFFDPRTEERVAPDAPLALSRTFIPARLADNPSLDLADPTYRVALCALDPVRREQLLNGNWLAKSAKGAYFKRGWFRLVERRPDDVIARVRAWDLAATEQGPGTGQNVDPDWTVGELWVKTRDGHFVLEDVIRFRGRPREVDLTIQSAATRDGRGVIILLPQDPGQAGKAQAQHHVRMLAGYTVKTVRATGDKVTRARPLSSQVEGRNVSVVEANWNPAFFEEFEAFPEGSHDDQVDAAADALACLVRRDPWSNLERYTGFQPRFSEPRPAADDWLSPSHVTDADSVNGYPRW